MANCKLPDFQKSGNQIKSARSSDYFTSLDRRLSKSLKSKLFWKSWRVSKWFYKARPLGMPRYYQENCLLARDSHRELLELLELLEIPTVCRAGSMALEDNKLSKRKIANLIVSNSNNLQCGLQKWKRRHVLKHLQRGHRLFDSFWVISIRNFRMF